MAEERQGIFRKEALTAPPERLDRLIQIVSPNEWLLLGTLLVLAAGVLSWCIWGRLPITVEAEGVIVRPHKMLEIQSRVAGELQEFNLHPGDLVQQGQVLAHVDQSEIRKQLEEDRNRLKELEAQDREKNALQAEQRRLESREFDSQKKSLTLQSSSRAQSLRNAETLAPILSKRFDEISQAVQEGLEPAASPELLEAQRDYFDNQTKIADLHAELGEIESKLTQLSTREKDIEHTFLEESSNRRNQILELRKNVAICEVQLNTNTEIIADRTGRVVEVTATNGQVIGAGYRLALLDEQQTSNELVCLAYFPVRDGKRIKPGMKIQVVPDIVKRERFGGIVGRVTSVSAFPVTKQGTTLLLGNSDIATHLLGDEARIEIVAELEKDPNTFSGYKWSSSKGPELSITAGTTANGRVTVERRAPVDFILPFLRSASGSN